MPDSTDKPSLTAYERANNLANGLGLSPSKRDFLLYGRQDGLFSERILRYIEKQLADVPVENRQAALRQLRSDVELRYSLETETPGIGKAQARKARDELMRLGRTLEEHLRDAPKPPENQSAQWVKKTLERKERCSHSRHNEK